MKIANVNGRSALVVGENKYVDINTLSEGKFSADPQQLFSQWDELRDWAEQIKVDNTKDLVLTEVGPPAPFPKQVLAVGFNYDSHVQETGYVRPDFPPVFTKFVSSFAGPDTEVELPKDGHTDWEVELVVILKKEMRNISKEDAWDYVAALTVGQDLSERRSQFENQGERPQFSMGKSFPGFAPMGPWAVSVDKFTDPNQLAMKAELNGKVVQESSTSDMIYSVPEVLEHLSNKITLYPGDVIFTGTPAGVGLARDPQMFIDSGDTLTSEIEGIGVIRQQFK